MAQQSSTFDEESLEIEVLRKKPSASSGIFSPVAYARKKKVNCRYTARILTNKRKDKINLKNGCCHSTPIQSSTTNHSLLKEYFNQIPLSVVTHSILHIENTIVSRLAHCTINIIIIIVNFTSPYRVPFNIIIYYND